MILIFQYLDYFSRLKCLWFFPRVTCCVVRSENTCLIITWTRSSKLNICTVIMFDLLLQILIILTRILKLLYFLVQILLKSTNIFLDIYQRHYYIISTKLLFLYPGSIFLQPNFRSCEKVYLPHGLDKYFQDLKIANSIAKFSTRESKPIQNNLKRSL
jgi:hypothetical protein